MKPIHLDEAKCLTIEACIPKCPTVFILAYVGHMEKHWRIIEAASPERWAEIEQIGLVKFVHSKAKSAICIKVFTVGNQQTKA